MLAPAAALFGWALLCAGGTAALYARDGVLWNDDAKCVRSLSGVIALFRAPGHTAMCVLQALLFAVLGARPAPALQQAAALVMLVAGVATTCFDVDEHRGPHVGFLCLFIAAVAAYSNALALEAHAAPSVVLLTWAMNAQAAVFLVWLWCARARGWDSVLTALEFVWLASLSALVALVAAAPPPAAACAACAAATAAAR